MSSTTLAGLPEHIAIVMDGNGRWASQRGLPRMVGHRQGTENIRQIIEECIDLGVRYLTLYAFSTENWSRPQAEVDYLMGLPKQFYSRERDLLHRQQVRLSTIGTLEGVPEETRRVISKMQQETASYDKLNLIMAFNYGGRSELVEAAKRLSTWLQDQKISEITSEEMSKALMTSGFPDPDLVIRCGNEQRLSNFLLWQSAYAELYFSPKLWPDFSKADLREAVAEYGRRGRRFGGIDTIYAGSKKES